MFFPVGHEAHAVLTNTEQNIFPGFFEVGQRNRGEATVLALVQAGVVVR
jgi:hypothetical protein